MATVVRHLPMILVVVAVCLVAAGCGGSKAKKKSKKSKGATPASAQEASPPAAEGFVVIQVNGEAQVTAQSELDSIRFELRSSYRDALRAHKQAQKKAEAAGEPFDLPKPPKPKIRITKRVFPSQAAAEAYREQRLARQKPGVAPPAPGLGQPPKSEGL